VNRVIPGDTNRPQPETNGRKLQAAPPALLPAICVHGQRGQNPSDFEGLELPDGAVQVVNPRRRIPSQYRVRKSDCHLAKNGGSENRAEEGVRNEWHFGMVQNGPIPGNTLGVQGGRQFDRISFDRKEFRRQPAPA
jgi:hypothetical protein